MRFTAILLLALVCCHAVTAVSLRKSAETMKTSIALERMRFIGKKSAIAQQVVAAVELHLTSGGKVDEVIQLVEQAVQDVIAKRSSLNDEFVAKRTALENLIAQVENDLVNERNDLEATNAEISRLTDLLSQLAIQIENLEVEIQDLNDREVFVNQARENDQNTYATRKVRDENSLEALATIISKLRTLQARGNSFLQVSKKEIERALSRIPKSNPIQALVQLSTKFDEEKLASVVGKLEQIQNAIQESYADDRRGEERSADHYELLISEINSVRNQKQAELAQAQADQAQAFVDLTAQESKRDNLLVQIDLNEELLANTQRDLESTIVSYTSRLAEADEAIAAVEAALRVLTQNKAELDARESRSDVLNADE